MDQSHNTMSSKRSQKKVRTLYDVKTNLWSYTAEQRSALGMIYDWEREHAFWSAGNGLCLDLEEDTQMQPLRKAASSVTLQICES